MNWSMVGSKPILVVAIVDRDLDRNRSVNKANDRGRDANKICVSAIRRACKTEATQSVRYVISISSLKGQSALGNFYPATSVTSPPPTTRTGSCTRYEYTNGMSAETKYLSINAKLSHGVNNAEQGIH